MSGEQRKELDEGDYQNGGEIINKETQAKEFKIEENFQGNRDLGMSLRVLL